MPLTLQDAISRYGAEIKNKLRNVAATGEPEEQLRKPFEDLCVDLAQLCGLPHKITTIGESAIGDLKTRPDYAIAIRDRLIGFVEIKAPGKGADPRRYRGHDKEQWDKLQSLPNLLYTDGNQFSLWRSGEPDGPIVSVKGDIETSGSALDAPPELLGLFDRFFKWAPIPPRSAQELARITARLCRFLREEVAEQLSQKSPPLTALASDWRKLLFPEATEKQFADGYAQAVTFGLLMARAHDIELKNGIDLAAKKLGRTNSLIGAALRLLTDDASNQETLKTSLGTLTRVLDAVNWHTISKDKPEAWLYFYEEFLAVYDNDLRKLTGSYYTPPEVVAAMVRLVDDVLRTRFQKPAGLASPAVTLADPAVGTGTFLLGVLSRIATTVEADEGPGAVPGAMEAAVKNLIAFEMQLGPFAVAQLRIFAELERLIGAPPKSPVKMYVTDTLGNPYVERETLISGYFGVISESRKKADKIKIEEPITVVIGNPPYKEKAMGKGGWIEKGDTARGKAAPLDAWLPPRDWGVGAHAKHLRNLYIYFWRWATWKVFDHDKDHNAGVVCFITVAGFLNGPGFQKMRDYLRRTADAIWVIDCSPEGHQPEIATRVFQGVQQPVCIVLVSRTPTCDAATPAAVHYRALPEGPREQKFAALAALTLDGEGWTDSPTDWRAPFLPALAGAWATYPALEDLFAYNGSGVMPGRTWIIAPDADSLIQRWQRLVKAKPEQKEALFVPHLRNGVPGDKHTKKVVAKALPGFDARPKPIADDRGDCVPPVQYGFRSFDRQWIIPDSRVINQPNPELWGAHSDKQVYLTAPSDRSPSAGPALSFAALVPDLHHYNGRGGRVFPLWRDAGATEPNVPPKLLGFLETKYKTPVAAADWMAYLAAVAAHPAYTARFQSDLAQPGLRIPLTANGKRFAQAVELGRTVIWLHTFGERYADAKNGRPASPPRLPRDKAPRIPAGGAISQDPEAMPDDMDYEADKKRLLVGSGYIDNVPPPVWEYGVSGKRVLTQWFSYRKKNREKPPMGDRRPPSELCKIQAPGWLAEYTTELLNVIHVLGRLLELEGEQAKLLEQICAGPTITVEELRAADALTVPEGWRKKLTADPDAVKDLFEDVE